MLVSLEPRLETLLSQNALGSVGTQDHIHGYGVYLVLLLNHRYLGLYYRFWKALPFPMDSQTTYGCAC